MNQESTEDLTTEIIKNSKEIMSLLKRDNIKLDSVNDYHIYPIADNDTPKLSADRLEYSMSNALFIYGLCDALKVKKMYNDISVGVNEKNIPELMFNTYSIAYDFLEMTSRLSIIYREDRTRYSMQLLADIVKKLNEEKLITIEDLYNLKEQDVIKIIENSKYKDAFNFWKKAKSVIVSDNKPDNVYYVHHKAKIRYINPLVNNVRISKINSSAQNLIDNNLSYDMSGYVYLKMKL